MSLPEDVTRVYDFGAGEVVELSYLEQTFDIARRTAKLYLKALHIEPLYIGKRIFFSLPTFKRIMYVLSRPDSPGFLFPGSAKKNDPRYLKNKEKFLVEVTPDILAKAADPKILVEMAGASGRDPSILKQFMKAPQGRPRKEVGNA